MRSRDAHISSRSARLSGRPPVLDFRGSGGWGRKAEQDRLPAIAKMAYGILVLVLVLLLMISTNRSIM